jgi:hypothetical protein
MKQRGPPVDKSQDINILPDANIQTTAGAGGGGGGKSGLIGAGGGGGRPAPKKGPPR